MNKADIERFMMAAILEGRKALPICLPNPPVGCVIVKDNQIIAKGYTNAPGEDHAEAMALKLIPDNCEDITLFVTLEPCSFQGRTPSCAKAIAQYKGVRGVYVGMADPHVKNQGKGLTILEEAGIPIHINIQSEIVRKDLEPYLLS